MTESEDTETLSSRGATRGCHRRRPRLVLLTQLLQRHTGGIGRVLGHDHCVVGNLLRLVKHAGNGDGFLGLLLLGRVNNRSDVGVGENVGVDDASGGGVASVVIHD